MNLPEKCACCERKEIDLRYGVCFDCATIEEIIATGTISGFRIDPLKGYSVSLAKTKAILELIKKTSFYP